MQDRTEEILSKESSVDNTADVKEEPVPDELMDATSAPNSGELPDATRNLIVALPPDMELNLDIETPIPTTVPNLNVTPCCVKLTRCDTTTSTMEPHIEVNVLVNDPSYDLRSKIITSGNKATSTTRSRRHANQNLLYVDLFHDNSSDDTEGEIVTKPVGAVTKRKPSHYRLAAHKYMLARKKGILSGPRVCTHASVVPKKDKPDRQ